MQVNKQQKLFDEITNTKLTDLPHTIMLTGQTDGDFEEVIEHMGKTYDIPVKDITEDISLDLLMEIAQSPTSMLDVINVSFITEKHQNVILKFIEEPPTNAWIVLVVTYECEGRILATITNRCVQWELEEYTILDLRELTDNTVILKYAKTPKQVEMYSKLPIEDMMNLAVNVVNNIGKARFSNCLVITSKMAFKDTDKGYPVILFLRMLRSALLDAYSNTGIDVYYNAYKDVGYALSDLLEFPLLNKEWLFNNLLLKLKQRLIV